MENDKKFFPIEEPTIGSQILANVTEKFPEAFTYWKIKDQDFEYKSKILTFSYISRMFDYFDSIGFDTGTTKQSFYKKKEAVPDTTPPEGVMIYSYKNIVIMGHRIVK